MKKALIILLSVLTVVFVAGSALAADVAASGNVEVSWGGSTADNDEAAFGGDRTAKVTMDLTKDFGDGVSAGLGIVANLNDDGAFPVDRKDYLAIDGAGWIELKYDLFVVTAKTEIDGNAANDLGSTYGLAGAAGVQVDVTAVDGLTLTGLVNAGSKYNFLAKAVYSADALTIGGGIQKHGADGGNDAMAAWASYAVIDGLTVGGEFASRTESGSDADAITGILGKVSYAGGGITADAAFLNQKEGFITNDDPDAYLARDKFKSVGYEGNLLYVDASYALTDDLSVNGAVDYILSGKAGGADIDKDLQMSFKVGADYALSEKIALGGSFKSYNKGTAINGNATYTFVDGVTGKLEVTNEKAAGDDKATTSYSVVLSAAL